MKLIVRSFRLIVVPTGAKWVYLAFRSLRLLCTILSSALAFSKSNSWSSHCSTMVALATPSLVCCPATYWLAMVERSRRLWMSFIPVLSPAVEIVSISMILPVRLVACFNLSTSSTLWIIRLELASICLSNSSSIALELLYSNNTFCSRSSNSLLIAAISLVSS